MKATIDEIAYALDTLRITRRIGFYFTLWLTYYTVTEMVSLANNSTLDGIGLGAVIVAITGPVSILQGAALKFHHEGHRKDDGRGT